MAHSESKESTEGTLFQVHAWNHAANCIQVSSESGSPGALSQREQILLLRRYSPEKYMDPDPLVDLSY